MNHHPPADGDPQSVGRWELIEASFARSATPAALLPTNKVFVYGGASLDRAAFRTPPPAELLDLDSMQVSLVSMEGVACDLWCGAHTLLEDGRLIFAGG